jgi:hypothetical protein
MLFPFHPTPPYMLWSETNPSFRGLTEGMLVRIHEDVAACGIKSVLFVKKIVYLYVIANKFERPTVVRT